MLGKCKYRVFVVKKSIDHGDFHFIIFPCATEKNVPACSKKTCKLIMRVTCLTFTSKTELGVLVFFPVQPR